MTEQRLQEIEASIGRIECPECGGSGVYLDVPTGNEACDECDGSGMVSQFPPADELIAAVRTLTAAQDEAEATIAILRSAHVAALQDVQDVKAENATLREHLQAAHLLVQRIDQALRVPAAEYVPAIHDVFALIDAMKGTGMGASPSDTLPPLPKGWQLRVDRFGRVAFERCEDWLCVHATISGVLLAERWLLSPTSDLITVLRHAHAAQQRLAQATPAQEGQ